MVTKLKNLNSDKIQKLKWWTNWKKLNCDKTKNAKKNSKTQKGHLWVPGFVLEDMQCVKKSPRTVWKVSNTFTKSPIPNLQFKMSNWAFYPQLGHLSVSSVLEK